MDLEVIKFGGSSLADNAKLKQAVLKTISFLEQNKNLTRLSNQRLQPRFPRTLLYSQ